MELSKRLLKIASMVDKCNCVADIGTDHAYIPIYLIENNICNYAVASDINLGPVEKARKNVNDNNLSSRIDCRLGGGLSTIKPKESQVFVIAGMGGNLIRDILTEGIEVFKGSENCVLQPVQNPDILRKFLITSGCYILQEELVFDEGKFYEIMKVRYNNKPSSEEPIYYEVAKSLIDDRHPLILEFINYKLNKYNSIYNNIKDDTDNAKQRKEEVSEMICKLEELLKKCH